MPRLFRLPTVVTHPPLAHWPLRTSFTRRVPVDWVGGFTPVMRVIGCPTCGLVQELDDVPLGSPRAAPGAERC